jgi:hypothetical protein
VRFPDLSTLLAGGAVPESLRAAALQAINDELAPLRPAENGSSAEGGEQAPPRISEDLLQAAVKLHEWVITQTVVEPELTADMLPLLPAEDLEMIAAIAKRERDTDALGVRLGVDPLSRWRTFREIHECPEGCEACEAARSVFSGYELDAM